jgi:hypothetical protein
MDIAIEIREQGQQEKANKTNHHPFARIGHAIRLMSMALLLITNPAASQENNSDKLLEEFLKEYLPGCRRLIDFYEHMMLEADYQEEVRYPKGKCERSRMHFFFKANAPLFLMETYYGENRYKVEPGTVKIQLITRHKRYLLEKPPAGDRYRYTYLATPNVENIRLGFNEFAFAPYCFAGLLLSDFLKLPQVQVTKVQRYKERRAERVAVHYHLKQMIQKQWIDIQGQMIFSPKNSWALLQHSRGPKEEWKRTLTYENLEEEIPRLKQICHRQVGGPGEAEGEDRWTIRRLVPGPVPEEEFTPAAYGLAEPVERPSIFPLLFWLALALLLLTILARLLLYLLRRRQRMAT